MFMFSKTCTMDDWTAGKVPWLCWQCRKSHLFIVKTTSYILDTLTAMKRGVQQDIYTHLEQPSLNAHSNLDPCDPNCSHISVSAARTEEVSGVMWNIFENLKKSRWLQLKHLSLLWLRTYRHLLTHLIACEQPCLWAAEGFATAGLLVSANQCEAKLL